MKSLQKCEGCVRGALTDVRYRRIACLFKAFLNYAGIPAVRQAVYDDDGKIVK